MIILQGKQIYLRNSHADFTRGISFLEDEKKNWRQKSSSHFVSLVKQSKSEGEQCKIVIRNARKEANETIKDLQKDGLSEDLAKDAESNVQNLTNEHITKVDKMLQLKEEEILTI